MHGFQFCVLFLHSNTPSGATAAFWFHSLYFVVSDAPFAASASRPAALATWNTLEKENMWVYTQRVRVFVCVYACMKTQRLVKHGRWLGGVYPGQPLMPVNPMGLGLPYCVLRMNIPMFVHTHACLRSIDLILWCNGFVCGSNPDWGTLSVMPHAAVLHLLCVHQIQI